jgi:hypothetical protein
MSQDVRVAHSERLGPQAKLLGRPRNNQATNLRYIKLNTPNDISPLQRFDDVISMLWVTRFHHNFEFGRLDRDGSEKPLM